MSANFKMNLAAREIPRERLAEALSERIAAKRQELAERDTRWGPNRVPVYSYLENIALPDLLGYDMNDLYEDAELGLELELRHRIFWLDNSRDDGLASLNVQSSVGMYFDLTLFGQQVRHSSQGVPQFDPHPLSHSPDMSTVPEHVDFFSSGIMPGMIRYHRAMQEAARRWYGDAVTVSMREFLRGPLDLYVQLRGYEGFVDDVVERPELAHGMLGYFARQRARWARQRLEFLGLPPAENTSIHDDWVNVPFISPGMFRDFVAPAYAELQQLEGPAVHFHSCGVTVPLATDLLSALPSLKALDVSGWNDVTKLDTLVDPVISFGVAMINTFTLTADEQAHRAKLAQVAEVARRRKLSVCAQAIVRLHDDIAEDIERMNRFIDLARELLNDPGRGSTT